MSQVFTKRIRCLTSEVFQEADLEDIVQHNRFRFDNNLRKKPFLGFYSTVNGYHHFHVRPYSCRMTCMREPENNYDPKVIKILKEDGTCVGRMPVHAESAEFRNQFRLAQRNSKYFSELRMRTT
eukprot:TCONS_00002633-protein